MSHFTNTRNRVAMIDSIDPHDQRQVKAHRRLGRMHLRPLLNGVKLTASLFTAFHRPNVQEPTTSGTTAVILVRRTFVILRISDQLILRF